MNIIQRIPFKFASLAMLFLIVSVIVFHSLVLFGVVPYSIVWGGRLENESQMIIFEAISITINLLVIAVVAMKSAYLKPIVSMKFIHAVLWLFVALFSLNTVGNLLATTTVETIVFTPLTFFSAILCYRLVIEKTTQNA